MKKNISKKLAGVMVGATSALLLFGSPSEALAAHLTASAQNGSTLNQVDSLVAFNLQQTIANQEMNFNGSEAEGNAAMNQWVSSIYYLMMGHLILSFILSAKSEEV